MDLLSDSDGGSACSDAFASHRADLLSDGSDSYVDNVVVAEVAACDSADDDMFGELDASPAGEPPAAAAAEPPAGVPAEPPAAEPPAAELPAGELQIAVRVRRARGDLLQQDDAEVSSFGRGRWGGALWKSTGLHPI